MSFRQQDYLQEMGIQRWILHRPQLVHGVSSQTVDLEDSCQLLIVSPVLPEGKFATLFEKVLKSFSVAADESMYIHPENLHRLGKHALKWVWFAGCQPVEGIAPRQLVSPLLSLIEGNPLHRRELWRQICAYQESDV
ncbi:DNA polymerase III subunit psi [Vibrio aerogenes CECT 7868]|uniref:DNA polymerase III subunit psi n=1 Tax=Vibrio aerogenes CECT 7868 TaxID=1216006 RepID=A0A1M5Y9E0_9VIBR|nr:DNA polymerase III subunit psi [Vibrio aerogenes]SHI08675.1 DNA polymerase III subunit psi [Vibrio aerogenes CECT 7868]